MKYLKNFKDFIINEQDDYFKGMPPPAGITVDTTRLDVDGRTYATGNEEKIAQIRTLSKEEMEKRDTFLANITAFAVGFVPLVGPFISAGILAGEAWKASNRGDTVEAGKNWAFAALSLAIPGLSLLKNVSRLGPTGIKALQMKLDKGEKLYTGIEIAAMDEIGKNPDKVAKAIEKALAEKGANVSTQNLALLTKDSFKPYGNKF